MDTNYHHIIEKYLLGKLDETEKTEFEKQIATDDLLKEQLNIHREIHNQISSRAFVNTQIQSARGETEELKSGLDDAVVQQIKSRAFVDKQIESANAASTKNKTVKIVRIAMAIAAVFIGLVFIQNLAQNRQMENLFAENFDTENIQLFENGKYRGAYHEENPNPLLNKAATAYENENYAEAEETFIQLTQKYPDNNDYKFYLAITQLQNSKTKESINTFSALYQLDNDFAYYEETRWYMALAFVKQNKKTKAKNILKELIEYEGYYFDKAYTLSKEL
ncbi:MAG: tetratricopeptide repeat protein [Candidatus Delongbacteria bacterium]|nr:tetratricopeptide repeat protein [Candidatus Delongbacteria bacterium]